MGGDPTWHPPPPSLALLRMVDGRGQPYTIDYNNNGRLRASVHRYYKNHVFLSKTMSSLLKGPALIKKKMRKQLQNNPTRQTDTQADNSAENWWDLEPFKVLQHHQCCSLYEEAQSGIMALYIKICYYSKKWSNVWTGTWGRLSNRAEKMIK